MGADDASNSNGRGLSAATSRSPGCARATVTSCLVTSVLLLVVPWIEGQASDPVPTPTPGRTPAFESPAAHAESGSTMCSDNGRCSQEYCDQVLIPAGQYTMGSSRGPHGSLPEFFGGLGRLADERPPHEVRLDAFCIDRYEVTCSRYAACVAAGACDPSGHGGGLEEEGEEECPGVVVNHYPGQCRQPSVSCANLPVNCKTRAQAEAYCEWIGRRLCTEAEWERAANGPGPSKREYPWGDAPPNRDLAATCTPAKCGSDLEEVDTYPQGASCEGVLNLVGNVSEWVSDWYAPYSVPDDTVLQNPTGAPSGDLAIARGGCRFVPGGETNTARWTLAPSFDYG